MPCDAPQSFCDGVNEACLIQTKQNATFCGLKTDCPTAQNLTCDGQSRTCNYVAQCDCPPRTYGLDCSCASPTPDWLPGSSCRNQTWRTSPNSVVSNQNGTINATDSGYFIIDGDFSQGQLGTLNVVPEARITITGDASLAGALLVNLSSSANYTAFLNGMVSIDFAFKFGNRSDNSTFDSIGPLDPIPACKILNIQPAYYALGGDEGLLVHFSVSDDPRCTPTTCGGSPPSPPELFACDSGTGAWVLNCPSIETCIVNANISAVGQMIVINKPTVIQGSLLASSNSTIRISVETGNTTSLTVEDCVSLQKPIEILLTNSGTFKNMTLLEYTDCGSLETPIFASAAWNDCENGYSRHFETSKTGTRVTVALLFIPVDPASCAVAPSSGTAVLESGFPVGGAVGIAVGIAVLVIVAIGIAIWLRSRSQSRAEKRKSAQELYAANEAK
jgi:hypothetical protein